MSRGIVTKRPGGGTATGRIIVTDPTSSSGDGLGSGVISADGGSTAVGGATPIDIATNIDYTEVNKSNLGDLVEFTVGADGLAIGINTLIAGKVISGELQDTVLVNKGEVVFITDSAHIDGKVVVQGGMLVVGQSVHIEGKVESLIDGSYVFVGGKGHIEGKVAVTGASYFVIVNSVVEGKVSSNNNIYASVQGCNIKGSLEVLGAKVCKTSGNTVEGQTNTPGCTA